MIYRKLKPDDATHDGDMYASPCVGMAGKLAKQVVSVSGCSEILRPIPDEPEDVVRVEGLVIATHDSPGYQDVTITVEMPGEAKVSSLINQRATLLIPRPDPPVPKCPYCGMGMDVVRCADGFRVKCQNDSCAVVVWGPGRPTRREAIEAMTPKGGGQ